MSDQLFDIVFRGDIVAGQQITAVKKRLMQLFKADEKRIDSLFSGAAVALKRNLDPVTAEKYKQVLIKAGAQVSLVEAGGAAKPKPKPKKKAVRNSSSTLSSRLEAMEKANAEQKESEKEAETEPESENGWTLAPVGSDLLTGQETATTVPVEVDTSALSVKPMEGNLLADSEISREEALTPDVSSYELADAGVDLIDPEDKIELPLVEIDTSAIDLAPVGSDLDTTPRKAPPPPPDTSAISLASAPGKA